MSSRYRLPTPRGESNGVATFRVLALLGWAPPLRRWCACLRLVIPQHQALTTALLGQASQQLWPVILDDAYTAMHFRSPVQPALAPDRRTAGSHVQRLATLVVIRCG